MVGIVCMHTFGAYNKTRTDLLHGVVINTLFCNAVSLFILISGFYAIKPSIQKVFRIEIMAITYSVADYLIQSNYGEEIFSIKELIRAFLPVFSGRYWFLSAYMLMLIFGNYINMIAEKLDQKLYEELLILMFLIFSVIPTITFVGMTQEGILHMLFMYLVGRWIGKYFHQKRNDKYYGGLLIALLAASFGINYTTASCVSRGNLFYMPFAKSSSIFIVFTSITILILITRSNWSFTNKVINKFAKHILSVYLFESAVRLILLQYIDIYIHKGQWYYIFLLALFALVITIICVLIDMFRTIIIGKVEFAIGNLIDEVFVRTSGVIKIFDRWDYSNNGNDRRSKNEDK